MSLSKYPSVQARKVRCNLLPCWVGLADLGHGDLMSSLVERCISLRVGMCVWCVCVCVCALVPVYQCVCVCVLRRPFCVRARAPARACVCIV